MPHPSVHAFESENKDCAWYQVTAKLNDLNFVGARQGETVCLPLLHLLLSPCCANENATKGIKSKSAQLP